MIISFIAVGLAFLLAVGFSFYLSKQPQGREDMKVLSLNIQKGAKAFLNRQYKWLALFVVLVAFVLGFLFSWLTAMAFILGSVFSALAGNLGMRAATSANARTAWACKTSQERGLKLAFFSGSIMSFLVVALGLTGILILFLVFKQPDVLFAFGFGASSIALFARVGGGIYTKSADIGADLVGKIEKKLAEDDPKNPAVIADQVGDNVGDVAGMGADLFESYVDSIIAAVAIGSVVGAFSGSIFPLLVAGVGIFASAISIVFVRGRAAMEKGVIASTLLMAIFTFILTRTVWHQLDLFYCVLSGLMAGVGIGLVALFYTSYSFKPTQEIGKEAKRGPAMSVLAGLSEGMLSTVAAVILVVAALLVAYWIGSFYGVALAGVGMLSTLGISLAIDCYGPIVDNAAGIAEMCKLGKEVRLRASKLDAIGNTTAAIGKGFAIGSAALTALVLFVTYTTKVGIEVISITNARVVAGLLLGCLIPFLFSGLTIKAVSTTATKVVDETRKQFKERIKKGKLPAYEKVISIVTEASLKKMLAPSLIAIFVPLAIGLGLGKAALGGFLAASICSGFLLAITFANSGGALDNAKKYIEDILRKKGSSEHEASVIGDLVGDPLKDCSGPSLNILLKLMAIVALVFLPLF